MTKTKTIVPPRTIFHLHIKAQVKAILRLNGEDYVPAVLKGEDLYYGSIKAIIDNHKKSLGIGIDTLYRHPWEEKPYENDKIIIKKGILVTTKQKS